LRTGTATDIIDGAHLLGITQTIGYLKQSVSRKERILDLQKILSELGAERDRIDRAIEALDGIASSSPVNKKRAGVARASGRRRGGITPEGRRRLSLAMKKRWAERRKKGS
jgi:hypothetical protein